MLSLTMMCDITYLYYRNACVRQNTSHFTWTSSKQGFSAWTIKNYAFVTNFPSLLYHAFITYYTTTL